MQKLLWYISDAERRSTYQGLFETIENDLDEVIRILEDQDEAGSVRQERELSPERQKDETDSDTGEDMETLPDNYELSSEDFTSTHSDSDEEDDERMMSPRRCTTPDSRCRSPPDIDNTLMNNISDFVLRNNVNTDAARVAEWLRCCPIPNTAATGLVSTRSVGVQTMDPRKQTCRLRQHIARFISELCVRCDPCGHPRCLQGCCCNCEKYSDWTIDKRSDNIKSFKVNIKEKV